MLFGKIIKIITCRCNKKNWYLFYFLFLRLACQCMAIILQFTESEKNSLIKLHMNAITNEKYLLEYNLRANLNPKDYLKLYLPDPDQYTAVEEVSLSIVGPPKQV